MLSTLWSQDMFYCIKNLTTCISKSPTNTCKINYNGNSILETKYESVIIGPKPRFPVYLAINVDIHETQFYNMLKAWEYVHQLISSYKTLHHEI